MNRRKKIIFVSLFVIFSLIGIVLFEGLRHIERITLPHGAKLTVFHCCNKEKKQRMILLCPGGGYASLGKWNEGYLWVPFFIKQNFNVAVLEYRMPQKKPEKPMTDIKEAMYFLRHHSSINTIGQDCIGMMGFSAGGHLVSLASVSENSQVRPDFAILLYPVISMRKELTHKWSHDHLLGEGSLRATDEQFSSELHVTTKTPPTFIAVSRNDSTVNPQNSILYSEEIRKHRRPVKLVVYPSGGHGWGYRKTFKWHDDLKSDIKIWLQEHFFNDCHNDV
jgi:acetyl esterase/lipase